MTEQFLHQFEVGAIFQQVRCKGMTQRLRCDLGGNLRLLLIFAQNLPKSLSTEPLPVEVEKERIA